MDCLGARSLAERGCTALRTPRLASALAAGVTQHPKGLPRKQGARPKQSCAKEAEISFKKAGSLSRQDTRNGHNPSFLWAVAALHRSGVKGAQHRLPETGGRELHPGPWPLGHMETFTVPFTASLGKSFMLKEHFKNKEKAFTASYTWSGRTQNVICLAKGNISLCRLLQFSLRVGTLLAVLLTPSNRSLNIDHTTENGKIVTKAFLVNIYILCDWERERERLTFFMEKLFYVLPQKKKFTHSPWGHKCGIWYCQYDKAIWRKRNSCRYININIPVNNSCISQVHASSQLSWGEAGTTN